MEPGKFRLLFVLAALLGFASISTDLFLPALPTMQLSLQASEGMLQYAISGYLLGFGFGQLFWGPVSDRFGRRGPIAIGVLIFAIGSAGCALSTDATQIIGWRVIQALGASAGVALARAMVRDLYDRDAAAKVLSTLMTVMAIAPLLGPSIGAQILLFASWQAIFWTLVAIGLATFVAVLTLPESLPRERREGGSIWSSFSSYGAMLANRQLMFISAAIGFFYVGVFANIAAAPFAYISYHGLSPQAYGLVFASGVFGLMAANIVNARVVAKVGSQRMLLIGVAGAAVFGIALALVTLTDFGGIAGLIAAQFLFSSMNGLILANGVAVALSSVATRTGAAAAVVGAIQYGGGMVGSALVGTFANGTPAPMGIVIAIAGCGSLLCVLVAERKTTTDRTHEAPVSGLQQKDVP